MPSLSSAGREVVDTTMPMVNNHPALVAALSLSLCISPAPVSISSQGVSLQEVTAQINHSKSNLPVLIQLHIQAKIHPLSHSPLQSQILSVQISFHFSHLSPSQRSKAPTIDKFCPEFLDCSPQYSHQSLQHCHNIFFLLYTPQAKRTS